MTDPDFDTKAGVSGADVVKESLRQKCIWNIYGGENADLEDQVRGPIDVCGRLSEPPNIIQNTTPFLFTTPDP